MKNIMPKSIAPLKVQAEKIALGADQYGGSLPLVINTAAAIRGDKTSLTDAVTGYEAAERELAARLVTWRAATKAGRQWLMLVKDTWKPKLGTTHNQGWVQTGLLHGLTIGTSADVVQALLESFKDFLTGHADFEAANLNITPSQAGTLLTALVAAVGAVQAQETHLRNLKADRDAKVKALRARLRNTINEMLSRMGRLDSRWLAFGLNMPGAPTTPKAPLNVTAVVIGPNAVSVVWEQSVYASYYRIWAKVIGVDQELKNIGDTDNTEFTVQPVATGAQLEIAVSAVVTGGGESAKSEIVTVTMPN